MLKKDIEELFKKCIERDIEYCVVRTNQISSGTLCSVEKTTIESGDIEDFLVINGHAKMGIIPVDKIITIEVLVPFERAKQ